MNTLKLKVVVLCFFFFTVGYVVATFNAKTPETKVLIEKNLPEYPYEEPVTVYQIKYGDTLDSIAKLFGVTKEAIMKENGLEVDMHVSGGWLKIPSKE